ESSVEPRAGRRKRGELHALPILLAPWKWREYFVPRRPERRALMSVESLECVTRLRYQERDIYLVGTAHVSQRSVDDVGRIVSELSPDSVCVELDATRHQALVDP